MHKIMIAACLIAFTIAAGAAETVKTPKSAKASKTPKAPLLEKLSCRTGPNDEQARLIVEAVKGRAMEFAFYSRLGTRVCSIHGRRGDAYTKWDDEEGKAHVKLLTGSAEIEYAPGQVKIKFSDVDRMRYCGMYGEINGSVEVISKQPECNLDRIFEGSDEKEGKAPG